MFIPASLPGPPGPYKSVVLGIATGLYDLLEREGIEMFAAMIIEGSN